MYGMNNLSRGLKLYGDQWKYCLQNSVVWGCATSGNFGLSEEVYYASRIDGVAQYQSVYCNCFSLCLLLSFGFSHFLQIDLVDCLALSLIQKQHSISAIFLNEPLSFSCKNEFRTSHVLIYRVQQTLS